MVTGIYPTEHLPHKGTFVKSQADSLAAAGVEVEILHPKPGPVLLRYFWTVAQVWLKTRTRQFDIVNGHYGQWCLFARLQWHTPVVATFHGSDLLGVPLDEGKYSKLHGLNAHVNRWLCGRVDAVIVQSEEMKRAAGNGEVFVIPTGVDFELFRPIARAEARAVLGWDPERYYIVFGNDPAIPLKGFKLAQAAVEHLQAKGIPIELIVANGLPQTQLVQYMNASNALILPSLCEGSPCVVKEAMACNIPVVATDVGDVAEVISRTEGCSVCSQDPADLAAGIERALQHAGPTTGRADIAHLENSVIAERVIAVYDAVLGTSPPYE
jgi:glycosyltransferase involved in cell wall biosynthesis